MSRVTGVMLICSLSDGEDIAPEINRWLAELGSERGYYELKEIADEGSGGTKHPQFEAWCGGFNWFEEHEEDFAQFAMTRLWNDPENVVLICGNEESSTHVYRPKRHAVVIGIEAQPDEPIPQKVGAPDFSRWR